MPTYANQYKKLWEKSTIQKETKSCRKTMTYQTNRGRQGLTEADQDEQMQTMKSAYRWHTYLI